MRPPGVSAILVTGMAVLVAFASLARGAETVAVTVTGTARPFAPIRYGDGSVSENDRCAVSRQHLNDKIPPVYVNGRVIGFC